jgi:hypothetical protein
MQAKAFGTRGCSLGSARLGVSEHTGFYHLTEILSISWNMMSEHFDAENIGWKVFLAVAFAFALSFTFPVRIRIIVGGFGDVTDLLGSLWTLSTGVATFLSLVLAVRNHRANEEEPDSSDGSSGPDTKIHIKTIEGDLHLNGTLEEDEGTRKDNNPEDDDETDSERVTAE